MKRALKGLRAAAKRERLAPDHPTPVGRRVHTDAPPPFCMAGHRLHTVLKRPFSESNAAQSDLVIELGHELMEYFLRA